MLGPGLGGYIFTGLAQIGGANAVYYAVVGTFGVVLIALPSTPCSSCSAASRPRRESVSDMTATPETTRAPKGAGERAISGAELTLDDVTKRYPGQKAAAVDGLS